MAAHRVIAAGAVLIGAAGLAFLLHDAPRGRALSEIESATVLPQLARSSRPGLAPWRDVAARVLQTCPSDVPTWLDLGPPPEVRCRGREVEVPAAFPQALALMAEAVRSISGAGAKTLPADLATGEAAAAIHRAFHDASRLQVPGSGGPYWLPRFGVLVRREGRLDVILAAEPLEGIIADMHGARGSWERAMAIYRSAEDRFQRGDPRSLISNLIARDQARGYDAGKRVQHLELTLQAVLPNLMETVTLDPAAILELGASGELTGEPLAVLALRQNTPVNQSVGEDDLAFASTVAPLFVLLFGPDGSATVTKLPVPRGARPSTAVLPPTPGDAGPARAPEAGTTGDGGASPEAAATSGAPSP